ncbi:peptidoglycan-binding protein [Kitasatospora herbaricolor]|uniref:peptidoglycan-binding domain-containing protein n=1 Tax=Kitasatospora herbaricolor TaxID=68217 RepID=UPI0036DF0CA8
MRARLLLGAAGQQTTVDGRYGPTTTDVVKASKQAHDLDAKGIAGPTHGLTCCPDPTADMPGL